MKAYWLLGMTALAGMASPAAAQVAYHVDFTDPLHHRAMVSATFPKADGATLDVKMPDWRTGAYTIRNLANGVSRFAAYDANGKRLPAQKIDKSTWRIQRAAGPVKIRYELFANELTKRTRHIDDSHAYLDASATFVYADAHRDEPVTVTLNTPKGWRSFSGMDSTGAHAFKADNFDILVDSPIETGINESRAFKVDGKDYVLVNWGGVPVDIDKMVGDLSKIVSAASPAFWSGYPFDRYVFMVHATDNGGGATEHLNSTVIQYPRAWLGTEAGYNRFLSTASHEFVHTWNVKAYRPEELVPYDYDRPNYTTLFWVAEGSTSYLTDPLLLEAGLIDVDNMLGRIEGLIHGNRSRPGRLVQSVAEASFDEWISPESRDRATNDWVNIYSEGKMVSWLLDMALLDASDGAVAYRDVHAALYERALDGRQGYGEEDMLGILTTLTGKNWESWWTAHVHSPVDPDYAAALATVGLEMVDKPKRPSLGIQTAPDKGPEGVDALRVDFLLKDGAGWRSGLTDGDLITSLGGQPATSEMVGKLLDKAKAGDRFPVTIIRRGELRTLTLTVGETFDGEPEIRPMATASERQKRLFEAWLRKPFPQS